MTSVSDLYDAVQVHLVEDGPSDVRLMQEALRDSHSAVQLPVASDGVDAMAFLRRGESDANAPRPDVDLLDLNLPKIDGPRRFGQYQGG